MALATIVSANVIVAPAAVEAQPLDIAILPVTLTGSQDALWGPKLVREVTPSDYLDILAEVGITDGETAYEFLQTAFGQIRQPRLYLLGKAATPVAEVKNFDLGNAGAAADGLYRLTLAGTNFDVNAVAQTRAQVVTSMIALVGADPRFGAVNGGDAEQLDVTAAEAGVPFTAAGSAPIGEAWFIATTTPNVGPTTDLAAWEAERRDWYMVTVAQAVTQTLADAYAQTAQSYPRDITVMVRTDSAGDPNAATSTPGIANALSAFSYSRLAIAHVPTATDFDHAAVIGYKMPTLPGSDTWGNKRMRGIDGELWTVAQGANLIAGPYVYFDRIESLGGALSQNVRVLDGTPLDVIRGADYLKASIIAAVLTVLTRDPAPQVTREGFGEIGAAISSTLSEFVNTGFIAATKADGTPGFSVTIPPVPPPGDPDRIARKATGFAFTALVAGSIEIVENIEGLLLQ